MPLARLEKPDIVFGDHMRRVRIFPPDNLRLSPEDIVHADDGLPAKLVRLLDNRAVNVAGGNPASVSLSSSKQTIFTCPALPAPRTAVRIAGPS